MKHSFILGIDEAGRGAWAGPVVAGACAFLVPKSKIPFWGDLADSKTLSEPRREELFEAIREAERSGKLVSGVGVIDSTVIDTVGIREANRLAMAEAMQQIFRRGAINRISIDQIKIIKIDGRDNYRFDGIPTEKLEYIVRGDGFVKEIQAASVIAKVTRDRLMIEFARTFPGYGFERHKGYGTATHQVMLDIHGPTRIHRVSYAPIKKLILGGESV